LNIQKKYTDAFLKSKGNYQIQKVPVKNGNKPINSKTSNERWGMDLINMSIGNTYRYSLSVVDNFSGFLWTRRITNRNRFTILNNLQNIIDTPYPRGSSGTYPRLIQADKGGEFHNNDLRNFCVNNNITLIFSKSYLPSSNGKIERKSREIRKKIKAGFIRQNRNY
jgi:transposase InsO family protein